MLRKKWFTPLVISVAKFKGKLKSVLSFSLTGTIQAKNKQHFSVKWFPRTKDTGFPQQDRAGKISLVHLNHRRAWVEGA